MTCLSVFMHHSKSFTTLAVFKNMCAKSHVPIDQKCVTINKQIHKKHGTSSHNKIHNTFCKQEEAKTWPQDDLTKQEQNSIPQLKLPRDRTNFQPHGRGTGHNRIKGLPACVTLSTVEF